MYLDLDEYKILKLPVRTPTAERTVLLLNLEGNEMLQE